MFRFGILIAAGALAVLPPVVHSNRSAAQGGLKPNLEDPYASREFRCGSKREFSGVPKMEEPAVVESHAAVRED